MLNDHFCNAALIGHVPHHRYHAVFKWSDQRWSKYDSQVTRVHLNTTEMETLNDIIAYRIITDNTEPLHRHIIGVPCNTIPFPLLLH